MILHICPADKFLPDFIAFVRINFNENDHKYIIFGGNLKKYPIADNFNTWHFDKLNLLKMMVAMQSAEKIIVHGLFEISLVRILASMPWLLKKCYWVMWGGDLYCSQFRPRGLRSSINELVRVFVIKRFGHFITHITGDYELAKRWFGANGKWHESFIYPSNLYKDYPLQPKTCDTINIQVGNSADPSNNHLEVLEKLKAFRDQDIQIYVPLSYGDLKYAKTIIDYGIENFGEKFIPLTTFMPFEKYLNFLAQIDIAIFNHRRQQGMGNTITLLGLGKKVFMRSDVTSWQSLVNLDIKIFDCQCIDLSILDNECKKLNQSIVKKHFSLVTLISQWKLILGN